MLLMFAALAAVLALLSLYVLAHVFSFAVYRLTGGRLSFRRWWKKMEI